MNNGETVIYVPNYRQKIGFFKTLTMMVRNIIISKELIYQLFKRDFLMTYKKSFLGFSWVVLSPILGIVSWLILNATGILNPGEVQGPYIVFLLINSSLWGLFMGFYSSAAGTLDAGQGFINQVKYPHEALLVKQTAQHLANFSITFVVNIVVLLAFGIVPSWMIILFPILILPLFFLGGGLGLIISVINVVTPDITRVFNMALGFVFYITPIIYSPSVDSAFLQQAITLNPLTYLLGGIRQAIIEGRIDNFDKFIIFSIISFIFFLFSWRLFFISEDKVIERMI